MNSRGSDKNRKRKKKKCKLEHSTTNITGYILFSHKLWSLSARKHTRTHTHHYPPIIMKNIGEKKKNVAEYVTHTDIRQQRRHDEREEYTKPKTTKQRRKKIASVDLANILRV